MSNIFTHKTLQNGIDLYICPTNKFKTISIYFFLHQNLKSETATKTALLPYVLKRGTEKFTTSRSISLFLDDLYGSGMGGDILKRGETQIVSFFMDMVHPKYVEDQDIFDKAMLVFADMILHPVKEDGGFKKDYVNQEKDVLKRNIESLYNDKFNYAIERCFQEMCKDEAYSIYKYGNIEDLDGINNKNLYEYYTDCLKSCPIDIFVMGDVNEQEITDKIEKQFYFERGKVIEVGTGFSKKEVKQERFVEERQNLNQGKLSMGFRTKTRYGDDDYYALMVYNGILGGGTHSKLFSNVREKASLAYYAFSRIEKAKGLMVVSCGIEFDDMNKTIDIIKKQLDDIRQGEITDYEYESTIKSLTNSLKEVQDSPSSIISMYLDGIINGIHEPVEDMIYKLKKVTKRDVVEVAHKIDLDTIFFLNKK